MRKYGILVGLSAVLLISSCNREEFSLEESDVTLSGAGFLELAQYFQRALTREDKIPDFSTVGYAHGDADSFPDYGNVVEVPSPGGGDDTQMIQAVIDNAPEGSVIRLKSDTYQVGGVLILDKNRVILRGAGRDNTVVRLTGTQLRPGIVVGATISGEGFSGRKFRMDTLRVKNARNPHANVRLDRWLPEIPPLSSGVGIRVAEPYCPVGRDTLVVADPSVFDLGGDVLVERPHNADWIEDVRMTEVWGKDMSMTWTRKVTGIEGNRLILDAPLVQSLDAGYGGGTVAAYTLDRVNGCGVENLTLESAYDVSKVEEGVCVDEDHAWYGMLFSAAEDCWASDVAVKYFGYAAVQVSTGARCITVEDCTYEQPVSYPDVARRYGFVIEGADLCLFRNCSAELSAMGFAVNTKGHGPNVFLQCTGTEMRTGSGPHQLWGTGVLYDQCYNDAGFRCTDHGGSGSGHGWTGANTVFWNVEAGSGEIECESPWAAENTAGTFCSPYPSGRNYCIGLVGGTRVRYGGAGWERPDAKWYPASVAYGAGGTRHVNLNEEASSIEWLRPFSKTAFTYPESLYLCQLEDRHSK